MLWLQRYEMWVAPVSQGRCATPWMDGWQENSPNSACLHASLLHCQSPQCIAPHILHCAAKTKWRQVTRFSTISLPESSWWLLTTYDSRMLWLHVHAQKQGITDQRHTRSHSSIFSSLHISCQACEPPSPRRDACARVCATSALPLPKGFCCTVSRHIIPTPSHICCLKHV